MGINPWQVDLKLVFQLKELVSIVSKSHPSLFSVIVKLQTFQRFISSSTPVAEFLEAIRWQTLSCLASALLATPSPSPALTAAESGKLSRDTLRGE